MAGRSVLTRAQILPLLAAAPARMAALTAGLAPAQLRAAAAPGEWSATEVLAHLRACADMWGDAIAAILTHDRPTLRAIDPRTWVKLTDYPQQAFDASLHAFTVQRAALMAVLEPLSPAGWVRAAIFTGAGKPLERTVFYYAHRLAIHERPHLKQIARVAKAVHQSSTNP